MWVVDISNHLVGNGDDGVTKLVYTAGVRWWTPLKNDKWHTFAQVNAVIVREMKENAATVTDLRPSVTLGIERELMWGVVPKKNEERHFAWRVQVDAYRPSSGFQTRISAGLVYRFDYEH